MLYVEGWWVEGNGWEGFKGELDRVVGLGIRYMGPWGGLVWSGSSRGRRESGSGVDLDFQPDKDLGCF